MKLLITSLLLACLACGQIVNAPPSLSIDHQLRNIQSTLLDMSQRLAKLEARVAAEGTPVVSLPFGTFASEPRAATTWWPGERQAQKIAAAKPSARKPRAAKKPVNPKPDDTDWFFGPAVSPLQGKIFAKRAEDCPPNHSFQGGPTDHGTCVAIAKVQSKGLNYGWRTTRFDRVENQSEAQIGQLLKKVDRIITLLQQMQDRGKP